MKLNKYKYFLYPLVYGFIFDKTVFLLIKLVTNSFPQNLLSASISVTVTVSVRFLGSFVRCHMSGVTSQVSYKKWGDI